MRYLTSILCAVLLIRSIDQTCAESSPCGADKPCPLSACCGRDGSCGISREFCGDKRVTPPSCGTSYLSPRRIGYYEGWSPSRPCDKVYPENIPIGSYTHLNFAYAFINPDTFAIAPMSTDQVPLFSRLTRLKRSHPGLHVWISIGGWSMNNANQPTHSTFSTLAASKDAQRKFIASLLSFMQTYGFDGVDISWMYPVVRGGNATDLENYALFLRQLRKSFDSSGHQYGISAAVPSSYYYMQHFDLVAMSKSIDWFNLMSLDLHGKWDATGLLADPFISAHSNLSETDSALQLFWRNGIDSAKVVLGVGFYGRTFTLTNSSCIHGGCPFESAGVAGKCTNTAGLLSYRELGQVIAAGAKVTMDPNAAVKEVAWGENQWASYDDAETIKIKTQFANQNCLGGVMAWAASLDDTTGSASSALSNWDGKLRARDVYATAQTSVTSCQVGDCGGACPSGMSPAQRSDGEPGNTGIDSSCDNGQTRPYCCPGNDMPTCTWRGKAPLCLSAECEDGEVEVSTSISGTGASCWFNHKTLCCKKTNSDAALESCYWNGGAPGCADYQFQTAGCHDGDTEITYSSRGFGGDQPCLKGYKSFCCTNPIPYQNCGWYKHEGGSYFGNPFSCNGQCPSGKQLIASDRGSCIYGYQVFCCDPPPTASDANIADFRNQLEAFKNDPTCPAGSRHYSKRELSPSSSGDQQLAKRSLKGANFIPILAQALYQQTYVQKLYLEVYEGIIARVTNFHIDNISATINLFPLQDPNAIIENDLCRWQDAIKDLTEYQSTQARLCIIPGSSKAIRSTQASGLRRATMMPKRVFEEANEDTRPPDPNLGGEPPTGRIMEAVGNNEVPLVYMRFINDPNQNQDPNPAGIIQPRLTLEIVYDIMQRPDLQNPRDPNRPDEMAVFHFHIDWFYDDYPGITAFDVFHAQITRPNIHTHDDRADGRGYRIRADNTPGYNHRTVIFTCDGSTHEEDRWYPGYLLGYGAFVDMFGARLRAQGVLHGNAFTTIWDPTAQRFNWQDGERERPNFLPDGTAVDTGRFTQMMDTFPDEPEPPDPML